MDCPKNGTDYLPLFKYLHLKIQTDGLEVPVFFLYHFFTDVAAKFRSLPPGWNPRALVFTRGFRHYECTSILDGVQA